MMSTLTRSAAYLCGVLLAASAASAERRDIHLPSGRSVGFTWYLNDGAGYRWDISSNGQVSDGSNDAYDGGMQLRLSGSYFSNSSSGRLSTDGREVEIGPWKQNNVQVYRRVYIDPKLGYCRWIDIFENPGSSAQNIAVQYYSNLGNSVQRVFSSSGKASIADTDWAAVTGSSSSSSRPAIAHVFASRGARVKPRFRWTKNNDSVYYDFTVKVPAGKAVAICVFQAQRRPYEQATKFLSEFKPRTELAKVPAPLRRIIVNMGGATLVLGSIDLPRHEKHDLAVLRNENELLGKILNERFDVETFYGRLDLPADRVIGVNIPSADDPHTQAVLVDGQVVAGKLLSAPVRIRLTNGNEMALPPSKLAAATFALSPDKPGEIKLSRPTIALRSGQRLAFERDDLDCTFQTQYGTLPLDADDLREIHFDTPEGGLHRAVFRNGSVLSGLLTAEDLKLQLALGPTLSIRRYLAAKCLFPAEAIDGADLVELTLRNEDVLYGRIAEPELTVSTQYGKVTVKPAEIAELLVPAEGALGQVRIKLHSGTTVTGAFVGETIAFQISPGPKLPVFLGHVVQMICPKRKEAPAPAEAEQKQAPGEAKPKTATTSPTGAPTEPAVPPMDERTAAERAEAAAKAAARAEAVEKERQKKEEALRKALEAKREAERRARAAAERRA